MNPLRASSPLIRALVGYALMLAVGVGAFLLIRAAGAQLTAPPPVPGSTFGTGGTAGGHTLSQFLIALLTIMAASRGLGVLFRYIHQPPVVGEVVAGILLGPSLLGQIAPGVAGALFPVDVTPLLGIVAQLGILIFMFLIGLELDTEVLREKAHSTVAISHASIVVPFLLGSALALWLYPMLSTRDVPFTAFALFMGISMSVTAFPVLARILTDRGLQGTRMGSLSLTCAAINDVTAWCLLAFVVGVVQSSLSGAAVTAVLTAVYLAFMIAVMRPLAIRFCSRLERDEHLEQPVMVAVCLVLLLSSLATEYIGIHALFGAFLIGAIIPHDSRVARMLRERLHDFVVVMLLPAFFAFTGLRTEIGLITGGQWWVCAAIIGVACLGKFGGSAAAARLTGMSWRDSAALGVLMNTRGLMELIVLNIGLDLKVISPTLFAMLVLMAVITTFMTTPILDALARDVWHEAPAGKDARVPA